MLRKSCLKNNILLLTNSLVGIRFTIFLFGFKIFNRSLCIMARNLLNLQLTAKFGERAL